MRSYTMSVCLVVAIAGCRQAPAMADGKIPITTRSDSARARYMRARGLNESLKPHEAYAVFQQAVDADSGFAMGEYGLASTAPTSTLALAHLTRALQLATSTTAPVSAGERLLILGLEARKHGDPDRTRLLADSLVAAYPNDERAHWTLGNACSAQQHYDCAVAEFQASIALNASYSLAYNQMGYAYRSAGDMPAAERAFTQYIELVPNDPNPYDSYAELLMKLGRFDESIVQYKKAQAIDPHFTGAFTGIAADEMYAGRYKESIAESERYLTLARDDSERRSALFNLTMTHVDRGRVDDAIASMERRHAIAVQGADTTSMSADDALMGDILLTAHRVDEASRKFTMAHALVAQSHVSDALKADDALAAHYDAARIALAKGQLATARNEASAYDLGATTKRNDTRVRQAHELAGRIELASGNFDASLKALAQADQQNPAVWAAVAQAKQALGDKEGATAALQRALGMNILPTLPYILTRAAFGGATRSATSQIAVEMRR